MTERQDRKGVPGAAVGGSRAFAMHSSTTAQPLCGLYQRGEEGHPGRAIAVAPVHPTAVIGDRPGSTF